MIRVRLYVGTLPNGLPAADRDGFGIFRVMNDFGEMNPIRGVAYEPEVPKCATCKSFVVSAENELAFCYSGECPREIKPDGSGYCHEHSDKPEKLNDVVFLKPLMGEGGAS